MSWLCPTELDRRRAVDTSDRVRTARTVGAVSAGLGVLVLAPVLDWWLIAIFLAGLLNLATVDPQMRRSRHPENAAARGMIVTEMLLVVAVAITGGPTSPILPWLIVPTVMAAARFRARVVSAGVLVTAMAIVALGLAVDARALFDHPELTIVTLGLLCSVAAVAVAIQGAEVQHRRESVLDPLTGLLNRKSLLPRFEELQQQARLAGGTVCMVFADIDGFKHVNDTRGHERGDAVLRETAYEMRKCLRSFELFYRLGGEEFLVVLPGIDRDAGIELAERLRTMVERSKPGGVAITLSIGVTAASGEEVEFESLLGGADDALYRAKHAGRNRVASAPARQGAERANGGLGGHPAVLPA
jgi:diguanylate cyclase (GGDEF)-like protein